MKMRILLNRLSCIQEGTKGRCYLFLLVVLLFSLNGFAQNRSQVRSNPQKITGYVFDDQGGSLTGVAVKVVQGISQGTVTDLGGQFILDVEEGAALEFSYLGYKTQTLTAKNGMRVVMVEAVEELEEVVVRVMVLSRKVT
jgi:hypothetical protein